MVEDSVLGSRYRTTVQQYLNKAYRHRIISAERPPAACDRCMPRDYTDSSTQLYLGCKNILYHVHCLNRLNTLFLQYQPRNRSKSIEPVKSPCHKWEVTPRKYYDTLNIVVVLKCNFMLFEI